MSRYEIYLFLHIVCAILWIGGGTMLLIQSIRAERANDLVGMQRALATTTAMALVLFVPASLGALVFGLLMVIDGPWSFGTAWVVLGLIGFAATFCTGLFFIKPESERLEALVARNGGVMGPDAIAAGRRMLLISRVDFVVLYLVVADMALKPTWRDGVLLAIMAVILVAAVGWLLMRLRATPVAVAAAE